MRTFFLFPFLLLLLPIFSVCQDNFQPGYVTTLSGDTLHGQIDYHDWLTNPDVIHFREKPGGQINFFPPETIRSFGVDNSRYESRKVHFEQSKFKAADYLLLSDYRTVTRLVFLEVLVDGPKKLYLLHDQDDRDQFFIGSDSVQVWLTMKKYLKTENGVQMLMTDKKYIGQLLVYFQDCPGMSEKIKGVTYQEKSLISLFRDFYTCKQVTGGFLKKRNKPITQFGLIAGLSATSISFRGEGFDHLTENDFPWSFNPSFGIFINAVIPRNLGRWSGYNELLFTTFRVESKDLTTRLGLSYLKMVNMIRFRSSGEKQFIFVNAGITSGIVIGQVNQLDYGNPSFAGKAMPDINKYQFGLTGGVGAVFGHFSIEGRYERSTGISPYTHLRSSLHRVYLLLGYRF